MTDCTSTWRVVLSSLNLRPANEPSYSRLDSLADPCDPPASCDTRHQWVETYRCLDFHDPFDLIDDGAAAPRVTECLKAAEHFRTVIAPVLPHVLCLRR